MRPTPTKTRPTLRTPLRSSPRRQKGKDSNKSPSARRSIKRGLEDSLGSPTFADTPVTKIQKSRRGRSPDVARATPAVTSSDKNKNGHNTPPKNSTNNGGGKPKKTYGRRAKFSPRTHGAAIANSLASPAIDSDFLMRSTAPITPSKRSTAESALHYLARNATRGTNNNDTTQSDDDGNNKTRSRKKQKRRAAVNAESAIESQLHNNIESPQRSELSENEFIPKGKLEERWLKNFNKWKQSIENQGRGDIEQQSPIPKSWVNAQRKEYKAMKQNEKTSMTQKKANLLESAGFTWDIPVGRPKRKNSSSNNTEENAAATLVSVKSDVVSKRQKKNYGNAKNEKSLENSSLSKRSSPRKSCPTQFYHDLLGKEDEEVDEKRSNINSDEKKKDKKEEEETTTKTASKVKEGYKCSKCGEPKKGHICSKDKRDEEDEKAVESLTLLASSSEEKHPDLPTKQKREGKKRRSRGGRQKGLSSLETLQTSTTSSKEKAMPSGQKEDSAKEKHADDNMEVKKSTARSTAPKKTKNTSCDATERTRKMEKAQETEPPTEMIEHEVKKSTAPKKTKNKQTRKVEKAEEAESPTEMNEHEATGLDDQPISPFPSSPIQTSNLECPESGSISVGQAQNSPAKKDVPESICIRELMMSCLTEEDKEEEKRNSEIRRSEPKPSASAEGVDDNVEGTMNSDDRRNSEIGRSEPRPSASADGVDNDDKGITTKADNPLPKTPIQSKETPLSTFSPLSMTSPLRANNLLETSYNEEPEVQDQSLFHEKSSNHPAAKRKSASTSHRPKDMVQTPPGNTRMTVSAEIATQTSDRVDEAKQLQLIQAEKKYQAKMAEFGKLELEAKMVAERMRQIEERMRQIQSSSISNDLREYDEMKRRESYHAETLRPSRRKMITSQRHYGSSEDEFSDDYDLHRNWRHSTHGRHGDRERSIKRRKIRSDSRSDSRRSRSPSRSQSQRSLQSERSNTQRRRIEDSAIEDDRDRMSVSRKHRKKSSKKKVANARRGSMSQTDRTSMKSPYAVLRSDAGKPRETRQRDESFDAKLPLEKDASDSDVEGNDTATSTESAKVSEKARENYKKDSDSSSTKQSSVEEAKKSNNASKNEGNTKDPLYWLAGGESDSDEESWDFDGPMILPPPPA